jgi:two-component system, NtrC family, response regulator AtoC
MIEKVLIADDEPIMRKFIAEMLERQGKIVSCAENGLVAIEKLKTESFDLIITDMRMPIKNGVEVMVVAKELHPHCLVIIATAHGSIEAAVDAVKMGAFNYLLKPFCPDALESILDKAEEHVRLLKENRFYREENAKEKCPHLIAESPQMKKILQDLGKIAKSHASVFITGESGTGKEVIGAAIHQLSSRSTTPFIKVNCAAIPETLVESEFFGHERGAFTGALQRKTGRFELADKGTLLLDEVTEIPLALQPKLLRAIQEQEFERVGGTRPIKVNIRFLATSNRNMQEAIESKVFREDLFYRLNVVPVHIPPLRERIEDILPLAHFFLSKFCEENHKQKKEFTPQAIEKLLNYPWPGNVRELGNIIERTVVLDFDAKVDTEHLYLGSAEPLKTTQAKAPLPQGISLHEVEKRLILETLETNHHNKSKTASILGISVRTLRNKLHEYGTIADD